ncbi:MAG: tetratricopeptide repeat protein [Candidatus Rokubacteria bacterium]|nr:tetratricopeptide repeat protein [Candidatus Rokubacteria bacterium]
MRALLTRGTEAAERGAFGEAAGLLRQATKLAPADPDAWNGLGVALVRTGEVAAGVEAFRRAVRLQPTHAEAERNLGVALDRQGKPREAADHYRVFLALSTEDHPARADVRRRLVEISSRKGRE